VALVDHIGAAWPLAASLALVVGGEVHAGRRRRGINEALHELRRPLQALAFASGRSREGGAASTEGAVELAAAALERLEREVNGRTAPAPATGLLSARPIARAAVERCRTRAERAGSSLQLRWGAGNAILEGDRLALGQALDNLIVNAIEHGGPTILVDGRRRAGRLRLCVADSGRSGQAPGGRAGLADVLAGLSGRRRRGHGLAVVRRVAEQHGGRFFLHSSADGSTALLELPLRELARSAA
jgi:signal transduction histidine kinase